MRKLVSAVALTLFATSAFAQLDPEKDKYEANVAVNYFTGVYKVLGQNAVVRMAYDKQTMRLMIDNEAPLKNLQLDSYDIANDSANISYEQDGLAGIGTIKRYADGLILTLDDGSELALAHVRAMTDADKQRLYCGTANTDAPVRGAAGYSCGAKTAAQ